MVFFTFLYIAFYSTIKEDTVENVEELRIEDRTEVEIVQSVSTAPVIRGDGELVYQYFYAFDSVTKEVVEEMPEYLLGANRRQIEEIFSEWQVLLFSSDKVILRQNVEAKSDEIYCISVVDGYIAIFHENDKKQMKLQEKTSTPISILSSYEQNQLLNGINIVGEENLVKIMADFTT